MNRNLLTLCCLLVSCLLVLLRLVSVEYVATQTPSDYQVVHQTVQLSTSSSSNTSTVPGIDADPVDAYFSEMLEWSTHPYSFCFESFANRANKSHSPIALLSISLLDELHRNFSIPRSFIFHLRLVRLLYATRYGYKYCEFDATFDDTRPPHWSKWNALRMLASVESIEHIVWVDIDATFHSQSQALQTTLLFRNKQGEAYDKEKILILSRNSDGKNINLGIFVANTGNADKNTTKAAWTLKDILDLFELLVDTYQIKTYIPTYDQNVLSPFADLYRQEFVKYCHVIGHPAHLQSFKGKTDYKSLVWHWTGQNNRYVEMLKVLKREIVLFIDESLREFVANATQTKQTIKQVQDALPKGLVAMAKRTHAPKWIMQTLICESVYWTADKQRSILGREYGSKEIKELCDRNYKPNKQKPW